MKICYRVLYASGNDCVLAALATPFIFELLYELLYKLLLRAVTKHTKCDSAVESACHGPDLVAGQKTTNNDKGCNTTLARRRIAWEKDT